MDIKIGEKEYQIKYTNRDIFDIEDRLDSSIEVIMNDDKVRTKDLVYIVWCGLRSDFPKFDDFCDLIQPYQYRDAGVAAGQALASAFTDPSKKK